MLRKIAIALLLSSLSQAILATSYSGKIISILPHSADVYFVYVDVSKKTGTPPECAKTQLNRYSIKASTPGGKALIATSIAARLSGSTVHIHGRNTCSSWGDTEHIEFYSM
jgi:hypothetical protein